MSDKTIIYNVDSFPEELTFEQFVEIYQKTGFLLWRLPSYVIDGENVDKIYRPFIADEKATLTLVSQGELKGLSTEEIIKLIREKNGQQESESTKED